MEYSLTLTELKAITELYELIGRDMSYIVGDIKADFLTVHDTTNGTKIVWYYDGGDDAVINIDTLELLDEIDIEDKIIW